MRDFEVWSEDGYFGVRIKAPILNRVQREACRAAPVETGGILVGYYEEKLRLAVVTDASLAPEDSSAGLDWFQRGTSGLQQWLNRLWQQHPRRYYLGEWHTHPGNPLYPSKTDTRQIATVAADEGYQCPEPLLLIVGGAAHTSQGVVRCFVFPSVGGRVELGES